MPPQVTKCPLGLPGCPHTGKQKSLIVVVKTDRMWTQPTSGAHQSALCKTWDAVVPPPSLICSLRV